MSKKTNPEFLSTLAVEFNEKFESSIKIVADLEKRAERDLDLLEGVVDRMFDQLAHFVDETGRDDIFSCDVEFENYISAFNTVSTRVTIFFRYDQTPDHTRSFLDYYQTIRLEVEKRDTRYRLRICEYNERGAGDWICTQKQRIIAKSDFDKIVKSLLEKAGEAALKVDLKKRVKDLEGRLEKRQDGLADRLSDKLSFS